MKEIARKLFVTLNESRGSYYILNDQNFVKRFEAINDDEAIKIFYKWCQDKEKQRRKNEYKAKHFYVNENQYLDDSVEDSIE